MFVTEIVIICVKQFIYDGVFQRLEYEIGHKLYWIVMHSLVQVVNVYKYHSLITQCTNYYHKQESNV